MTLYLAPIVEGQTEQLCVERLLHRIWYELLQCPDRLQVLEPIRGRRDVLIDEKRDDLARAVEKAQIKARERGRHDPQGRTLVLVLLDAEDDCPAKLGPRLLETARKAWSGADERPGARAVTIGCGVVFLVLLIVVGVLVLR